MKKWILGVLIVSFIISLTGCFRSDADDSVKEEMFKTVKTEIVNVKVSDQTLAYSGIVNAEVEKKLSFKFSGFINKLVVNEGDIVEIGQILAILDTTDLQLQVTSIGSQLQALEKEIVINKETYDFNLQEYNNAKVLYDGGVISKITLDSKSLAYEKTRLVYEISKDNYNKLISERSRLDTNVKECSIRADKRGIIDQILVEESEFVSPGQPAFVLRSEDQMVVTYVTGVDRREIEENQKVILIIDGVELEGKVSFIDDAADSQTYSYRVEIAVNDDYILNGAIANIEFVIGEEIGIWIPIKSIQTTTIDFVYLINKDRSTKQAVKVLKVKGDEVLIEGLVPGDIIVVSGMKSLIEGMLVKASE